MTFRGTELALTFTALLPEAPEDKEVSLVRNLNSPKTVFGCAQNMLGWSTTIAEWLSLQKLFTATKLYRKHECAVKSKGYIHRSAGYTS
jgi:hypothetical protein